MDLFGFEKEIAPKVPSAGIAIARNSGRWIGHGYNWATPPELFAELDREFHFTLDVCAQEWNKKVDRYFSEADNGLTQDWGQNVCFMNPPYGKELPKWMAKAFESCLKGAKVVCLVPAATDTDWWHRHALRGEIRYLRGRPRFLTLEQKWQQIFSPSVIVIFGESTRAWAKPFDKPELVWGNVTKKTETK